VRLGGDGLHRQRRGRAVARRSGAGVLIAAVAGLAIIVSGFWLRMPLLLILVSIGAYFASNHVLRKNTRNAQHASQSTKLAAAHIALLAGSFLFLTPFAWLLSTSLKPDDEMAVFPPRWIPTQQVAAPGRFKSDDKPAGMSTYASPEGATFTVIETEDLPTGEVIAEVVTPAERKGDKLTVKRQDLTKIREVSPRWENYSEALAFLPPETNYGLVFLRNTLFLTMMTVIGTVLSSSVVAYSFARLNWPGKEIWFGVLLATMMIPGA
jgi:multiple sugar transport system permease protein